MQQERPPGVAWSARGGRSCFKTCLPSTTQTEALHDRAVAVDVFLLHVVQKATTLTHEQQQATTAVVVVLVLLEVLGQVRDAVAEQRHLDLRRAGVALGQAVLGDDLLLGLRVGTLGHATSLRFARCAARRGLFTRALSIRGRPDGDEATGHAAGATAQDYQRPAAFSESRFPDLPSQSCGSSTFVPAVPVAEPAATAAAVVASASPSSVVVPAAVVGPGSDTGGTTASGGVG